MRFNAMTMNDIKTETGSPAAIAKLRRRLLLEKNNHPDGTAGGLPALFVEMLTQSVRDFLARMVDLNLNFASLPEHEQLSQMLKIHLNICQQDVILAEELGRRNSHAQLVRIIQCSCDQDCISESNQDVILDLQDMACSIAATYATFPMRFAPFSCEELRQRLPLVFDISPVSTGKVATKTLPQCLSILIQQVVKRQSAQEDVGFVMWPSAVVLAKWVASNPQILQHATSIIEIGAGCGLVGLLAARMIQQSAPESNKTVILTDFNPLVLDNLKQNIALNCVDSICSTQGLDFYQQQGLIQTKEGRRMNQLEQGWVDLNGNRRPPADIILAADMICQPSDAVAASRTIHDALRPGGQAFIVCATSAHRFGVDIFAGECRQMNLSVQTQNVANLYEGGLLGKGLEVTAGYVEGMELTMFTIEKPCQ